MLFRSVEKIEVRKEAPILKPVEKIVERIIEKIEPKVEEVIIEKISYEEKTVETPIEKIEEKMVEQKSVFEEPETRIEELTPFDEVLIQSNNIMDLGMVDAIEVVDYSTPFDDLPTVPTTPIIKEIEIEKPKEIAIEPIIEHQVQANIFEEIEVVPIEDAFEEKVDVQNELYEQLTAKVYDRDPDLGECFEKNFIFNGFENNKLFITDRKSVV